MQLGGGWTISGISTWQKGGYIPAVGSVNFGLGLRYTGLPATRRHVLRRGQLQRYDGHGSFTALGDPTYFGTDEGIPIRPVLTCNPTSGLTTHQVLNGKCFNAPAVGTQGGQAWPYMSMTSYLRQRPGALSDLPHLRKTAGSAPGDRIRLAEPFVADVPGRLADHGELQRGLRVEDHHSEPSTQARQARTRSA